VSLAQIKKNEDKHVFLFVYSYTFLGFLFSLDRQSVKKDGGLLYEKKRILL